MNRKIIIAAIVSSALLTVSFAAWAQSDYQPTSPTSDSINVDAPPGPPQAAFDACSGKADGDSCTFTDTRGTVTGQCRMERRTLQLACAPNRGEGENGQGRNQQGGQASDRRTAADPACLKAALTTQSQTVLSALDKFYAAAKDSFTARITALLTAADLTGQDRMTAVQEAEKAFQKSQKEAQDAWQKSRLVAAEQFQKGQRACGGVGPEVTKQAVQVAIDACSGKIEGDSCTFTGLKGNEETGSCKSVGDQQLACAPAKPEGQQGGDKKGGELPQAALDACSGKADGDSCTFTGPKGAEITGACKAEGESGRTVCKSTKPEGQGAGQTAPRRGFGSRVMDFFRGIFGGKKGGD